MSGSQMLKDEREEILNKIRQLGVKLGENSCHAVGCDCDYALLHEVNELEIELKKDEHE